MQVPLQSQGQVIGVLTLNRHGENAAEFDEFDLAVAQQIADHAALSLINAKRFDEARRINQRLSLVSKAAQEFSEATSDLSALFDVVTRRLAGVLGGLCVLRLVSDDGAYLDPYATAGGQESVEIAKVTHQSARWRADEGLLTKQVNEAYTFRPTGTRYAVAATCNHSYTGGVAYGTTAQSVVEVCGPGAAPCGSGEAYAGTVKGSVSNVGGSQWLVANDQHDGYWLALTGDTATYSINFSAANSLAFGIAQESGRPLSRIAVLRDAIGATTHFPATIDIDFDTAGKPVISKSLTISGLAAGDTELWHDVTWFMNNAGCGAGLRVSADFVGNAVAHTYAAVDPSFVQPGDYYSARVSATKAGNSNNGASVYSTFTSATDITLPIAFAEVTPSLAAVAPYLRAQASFPPYTHGTGYVLQTTCASIASAGKPIFWYLTASADWLGACTDCRFSMPDLSALPCWNSEWVCGPGSPISASFMEIGQTQSGDRSTTWAASQTNLELSP